MLNAQQQAFVDFVVNERDSVVCEAAPGSGKSTTLRAAVDGYIRAHPSAYVLTTSYATKVIDEHGVLSAISDVRGIHAMGRSLLVSAFPRMSKKVDEQKLARHVTRAVADMRIGLQGRSFAMIANTVSLAKAALVYTAPQAEQLVREHGPWSKRVAPADIALLVLEVMRRTATDESCFDFDDMIWMPYVRGLLRAAPMYNVVFFDELQDASAAQGMLALSLGHRFVGVGDGQQHLYGWAGADPEIIGKIVTARRARTMTLPVSYRCGRRIVEAACAIFPDAVVAAPDAPEGDVVRSTGLLDLAEGQLRAGDFVISRTNFAGLKAYLQLTDAGTAVPVVMEGRAFQARLEAFADEAGNDLVKHAAKSLSTSEVQCIDILWRRAGRTLDGYRDLVRSIFRREDRAAIVLTVHQAKGRGADGVHILQSSFEARSDSDSNSLSLRDLKEAEDRQRLLYTAITRAKTRLTFVEDDQASLPPLSLGPPDMLATSFPGEEADALAEIALSDYYDLGKVGDR